MSLTITGRIIHVLPLQSGVSQKGNSWQRQEYVLETIEQYPKKVAFSVMNGNIAKLNIQLGQTYTLSVDIDSREYQGKWFTSVNAWNATLQGVQAAPQPQQYNQYQQQPAQQNQQPQAQAMPPLPQQPAHQQQPPLPQQTGNDLPF